MGDIYCYDESDITKGMNFRENRSLGREKAEEN